MTGPTGSIGPPVPTKSTGPTGTMGTMGSAGSVGYTGTTGSTVSTDCTGPVVSTGPTRSTAEMGKTRPTGTGQPRAMWPLVSIIPPTHPVLQSSEPLTDKEFSETYTLISLMETLTDCQRVFGVATLSDKITKVQGADFIIKCVTKKVDVTGKHAFEGYFLRPERSKGRSFYKFWIRNCETEEDKQWHNFINHLEASDKRYQQWIR